MATPIFDPSQPFEVVSGPPRAPAFDPTKPFEQVTAAPTPAGSSFGAANASGRADVRPGIFRRALDFVVHGSNGDDNAAPQPGETADQALTRATSLPSSPFVRNRATDAAFGQSFGAPQVAGIAPAIAQAITHGETDQNGAPLSAMDVYRQTRDSAAADIARREAAAPGDAIVGSLLGGAAQAAFLPEVKGAGLAKLLKQSAQLGALGAANGAFQSKGDLTQGQYGQVAGDALKSGGIAAAIPVAANTATYVGGKLINGFVKPTAIAQLLRSKGVNLTLGQMNPSGAMAQMEDAATSLPGIGRTIEGQRDAARESWQDAVLRAIRGGQADTTPFGDAGPDSPWKALGRNQPALAPLPGADIAEKLDNIYKSFEGAYAPAKEAEIIPQTSAGEPLRAIPAEPPTEAPPPRGAATLDMYGRPIPLRPSAPAPSAPGAESAFDAAIEDPSVLATDQERGAVRKYLNNQLSLLPEVAPGQTPGPVQADKLLQLRSNIRQQAAQALKAQDFKTAALLDNAERVVTGSLESQLPPDALAALQRADQQYARYKTVERAQALAGDQISGLTPARLSQAVKADTERGAYARGAGGDLRDLASAGRETIDSRIPVTGARVVTAKPFGYFTGPLSAISNLDSVKPFFLGETAPQRYAQQAIGSFLAGGAPSSGQVGATVLPLFERQPIDVPPALAPSPALAVSNAPVVPPRRTQGRADAEKARARAAALRKR